MTPVNFLPESYTHQRARKVRVLRQVMLVAVVAGGLAAWGALVQGRIMLQADQARMYEEQVVAARNMQTEMTRLREKHGQLTHQIKIQRELNQPLSHTAIIATLAGIIPEQIALTELTMTTHRAKPRQAVASSATQNRRRAQPVATVRPDEERISVELQALSPDGASVANLVEAFSNHPMVTDVQMRHTRAVETRGVVAREFRLELEIDLDRRFMDPHDAQEVASAD